MEYIRFVDVSVDKRGNCKGGGFYPAAEETASLETGKIEKALLDAHFGKITVYEGTFLEEG